MQSNSFSYSIKVWLTSVGLAPIIYLLIESCIKQGHYASITDHMNEQISIYAMCVLFGGIFSLLTWVLFYLIIKVTMMFYSTEHVLKCAFAILGALLTAGTFALVIPGSFYIHGEFFYLMIGNCMCIAGGSLFYNLEINNEQKELEYQ